MIRNGQFLWRRLTAMSLASSLAACVPAGGEPGERNLTAPQGADGEAGAGGDASPGPTAPAPSGEAGEAGLAGLMDGLGDAERAAVRLQQLKGFFIAADALMGGSDLAPAGVLIGQGVLEVYHAFPHDMAGYDPTRAEAASRIGLGRNPSRPAMADALRDAMAGVDAQIASLDVNGAVIAGRMIEASEGLYRHVDLGTGSWTRPSTSTASPQRSQRETRSCETNAGCGGSAPPPTPRRSGKSRLSQRSGTAQTHPPTSCLWDTCWRRDRARSSPCRRFRAAGDRRPPHG